MIEEFLKGLGESYSKEELLQIQATLNLVKNYEFKSKIYNFEFAIKLGNLIHNNKLGFKALVAGLYFPFIREGINSIPGYAKLDDELKNLLQSLNSIEHLHISTKQEQLDSIKNMFMGIAKEMRVVIIKLFIEALKLDYLDRFTNDEVESIMKGYSDIFAPISAMLGMSQIKNKLENATFKYYKPKFYEELSIALNEYFEERNQNIEEVISAIKKEIATIAPNNLVYGRQKQMASIAKKLQSKNMSVKHLLDVYGRENAVVQMDSSVKFSGFTKNHIVDLLAVRVIVNTVDECYAVLGKIYSMFKPFGDCKDYISHPKENGYQSLHTAIILDNGDPVEVQIRTFDMHQYAEYGFAAHWAYKDNKKVKQSDVKINYIRSIMDMYKEKSSDELLDVLKTDVYVGRIFVQTPQGKIMEFPEGATTIDFAYSIHSKIGDACVGAKINGRMVPLSTTLNNGDIVEIITSPNCKGPSRDWLKLCKTASAKAKINSFFKKSMKEENIKKGRTILENQCKTKGIALSKLWQDDYIAEVLERYSFSSVDDMLASIGYGAVTSIQIFNKLYKLYKDDNAEELKPIIPDVQERKSKHDGQVSVRGYSNMLVKFAKCCSPLPGDDIIGYVSRGKGVTIHRADCESLKLCEFDRLIECTWNESRGSGFVGAISITAENKGSSLSNISKRITDSKLNIVGLQTKTNSQNQLQISLQVSIGSKTELDELMNKIKNLSCVYDVYRNE